MKYFAIVAPLICVLTAPVLAEDLGRFVDGELCGLVSTYKGIHAHPELSHRHGPEKCRDVLLYGRRPSIRILDQNVPEREAIGSKQQARSVSKALVTAI